MDIISSADLASYLRDAPVADDADAALIVALANGIVSDALGDREDTYEASFRERAITLEVAARAWRNPNGYSSESIDDYTYRRDADTRQAGVYLTPAERAELGGVTGGQVYQAWL